RERDGRSGTDVPHHREFDREDRRGDLSHPEGDLYGMQRAAPRLVVCARRSGRDARRLRPHERRGVSRHPLKSPLAVHPLLDLAPGFLVPGVGSNGQRGAYLGLTHYWVTGRPTDLTTTLDLYSGGTIGLGQEFRWTPTSESAGIFQGYAIHDRQATVCVPLSE